MGSLPNYYKTNMRLNFDNASKAEGTADHVTLFATVRFFSPTIRSGKENKALKREANPLPLHLRQQQRRGRSRKSNLALVPDQRRTTREENGGAYV